MKRFFKSFLILAALAAFSLAVTSAVTVPAPVDNIVVLGFFPTYDCGFPFDSCAHNVPKHKHIPYPGGKALSYYNMTGVQAWAVMNSVCVNGTPAFADDWQCVESFHYTMWWSTKGLLYFGDWHKGDKPLTNPQIVE